MNLEIINLGEICRKALGAYRREDLEIYEISSQEITFYERDESNSLSIYSLDLATRELRQLASLDNDSDRSQSYIGLEALEGDTIYYSMEDGGDLVYGQAGPGFRRELARGAYEVFLVLNQDYGLGLYQDGGLALIDLADGRDYRVRGLDLEYNSFEGIRILKQGGQDYLVFMDYIYDHYDYYEIFIKKELDRCLSLDAGLYIVGLEDFVARVKAGEEVAWTSLYEAENFSYINPVNYGPLENFSLDSADDYYFSEIDYIREHYSLYRIGQDLKLEKLVEISYEDQHDPYNIGVSLNPISIGFHREGAGAYSYKMAYPEDYSYRSDLALNERLEAVYGEVLIISSWQENGEDYREFVKIKDRQSLEDLAILEGQGILDSSQARLFII